MKWTDSASSSSGDMSPTPCVQKASQFSLFRATFQTKCCRPSPWPRRTAALVTKTARRVADTLRELGSRHAEVHAPAQAKPVVERCAWRPVHKRKAEDAWSCARRRRRRSCSSRSAIRRPDAGSCHQGRELVARAKTARDPAASRQRRPACPVRHAPPAPAFFYEHAEI